MVFFSATDIAIREAVADGTIRIEECVSRFEGETFVAIRDSQGTIEVVGTLEEAENRVASARMFIRDCAETQSTS